ncbi:Sister chromatid cohesion protein PDS5-like protein B-B [Bienertia sinuspersici]
MGATVNQQFLENLKDVGDKLLQPPSSTNELLNLLDEAVLLLSKIGQSPSQLVHEALLSMMKALISEKLMGNSDADVMITVAACLNEILRISAPVAPYNDEKMKEIFELIVLSFDKLSSSPGRCYSKAVLILESVARLRSCVMMLDLDCHSLVTKMFELFQKHISTNHPQSVISAMEKIMSVMIIENDSLPAELLKVLLDSIKKENEKNSPAAFNLGAKVIEECSEKLQPYIMEAITSMGCRLDDYAPFLSSICETESIALEDVAHDSAKHTPLKAMERCSHNPEETASKEGENLDSCNLDEGDESFKGREKKSPESPHVHMKSSVAPRSKKAVPVMEDEPSKRATEEIANLDKKKVHQASFVGGSSDKKGKPLKKDASGGSRKKSTTGSSSKDRIQTNNAVTPARSQRKRASSDDDVFETPHGRKITKRIWLVLESRFGGLLTVAIMKATYHLMTHLLKSIRLTMMMEIRRF